MPNSRPSSIVDNQSLKNLNTWLVGGAARFFAQPQTSEELGQLLRWADKLGVQVFVLGSGSNVLVSDAGFSGLVICTRSLTHFSYETTDEFYFFTAGSGVLKSELLKHLLRLRNPAALFLAGIPGTLGGGVAMNAGVAESLTPREFVEITDAVELCSRQGDLHWKSARELSWGYRHCTGFQPEVIAQVRVRVGREIDDSVPARVRELNQRRLSRQPLTWPSCGSVFRNPPQGPKAAQLIEQCGLKGLQVGGAQVSPKHANFILNLGTATAQDIEVCMDRVRSEVLARTGVELQTEVVFVR